jgi:proteasome accessory factor B
VAKLDRLLNLVAALIDTTVPLTAEDIRERVPGYSDSDDAFHRSFERDKDDLRELGVPIEIVTVEHLEQPRAGYTILRDRYELEDPGLEPDELAALHLAATTIQVEGLDPDDVEEGLRKLGGLAVAPTGSDSPMGAVPMPRQLLDLFGAILERRVVEFGYGDATRHVQPYRLQFERGRWYLSGHDVDREAPRSFRLDRIDGAVRVGEERDAFDRPDEVHGVVLRPWELGDGAPVPTRVLVDRELARAVLADDPGLVVVDTAADGARILELGVRNPGGLYSFMTTLLDRAEILSPPEYRDQYVARMQRFAAASSDHTATDTGASA